MELRFTKKAEQEYLTIVERHAEYSGPIAANKFINKVETLKKMLLRHPYLGHPEVFLADRKYPYRSKSITKYYRMVYFQKGDTIWIVDFWDSRRDPAKLAERIKE